MITPNGIMQQVNALVTYLVEVGLADDQNFAFERRLSADTVEITFSNAEYATAAMKNRGYAEIYQELVAARAYSVKMPDGALLQIMYAFTGDLPEQHRLAFFPSPHLEEFQSNPELYLEDEIYADVVARNIVPFPVRFDYDAREGVHRELVHPKSHLTLGQYERCRIPVTAPLTPSWFIDFILRNFYHTAFNHYADRLPRWRYSFEESILPTERGVVHVVIPT